MTAFARFKFTFMALLIVGLFSFMRAAHSAPTIEALPLALKPRPVPITRFCESKTAFREMRTAYKEGGAELAAQAARMYLKSGVCHHVSTRVWFTPGVVVEKFEGDWGVVIEGIVEHVSRGEVTVYILISESQLENITEDIKV